MADSSPRLTPAAIEAAARDAGTLLLSRPWLVEDEVLERLLTEAGHSRTLAGLALQYLVERNLATIEFRPYADDVHKCFKQTDTLRDWLAATQPGADTGASEGDGGAAEIDCLVTLQQAAAMVNRVKKTLERCKKDDSTMPQPRVSGGGGKFDEWAWDELRPGWRRHLSGPYPSGSRRINVGQPDRH